MGIIKAAKLAFDYLRYDEDGNVEATQRAVDGVDLDIQAGEFVAVLGHNGSGKSTFAKHINALLLPTVLYYRPVWNRFYLFQRHFYP